MRQMPALLRENLTTAVSLGHLVLLEIEVSGEKLYARSTSIFGDPPVSDPLQAKNYAVCDTDLFDILWRDVNYLYIKDQGGGKSALRSDIPGRIVVFEVPKPVIKERYIPELW